MARYRVPRLGHNIKILETNPKNVVRSVWRGFTILETLIVLTVTSALLLSAMVMISGRQGRIQFAQGVRETEALIRDAANDVSTGIVPSGNPNLSCDVALSGSPTLSTAGSAIVIGKNSNCILVGKVLQLGTTTSSEDLITYQIIGRRIKPGSASEVVSSFQDTLAVAIHPNTLNNPSGFDATERSKLPLGIQVVKDGTPPDSSAIAVGLFYNNFKGSIIGSGASTGVNSGISGTAPMLVGSIASGENILFSSENNMVTRINSLATFIPPPPFLASGTQLNICLKSGTSNQYAVIILTSTGTGFNTSSVVDVNIGDYKCS